MIAREQHGEPFGVDGESDNVGCLDDRVALVLDGDRSFDVSVHQKALSYMGIRLDGADLDLRELGPQVSNCRREQVAQDGR